MSSAALLDVLHAVINGGEGCLLVYGASNVGKTSTMVGNYGSNQTLGIIPSAIAWMYSLIDDSKQRTGARISIRVSAVEVVGKSEHLKDLLSEQTSGKYIKSRVHENWPKSFMENLSLLCENSIFSMEILSSMW